MCGAHTGLERAYIYPLIPSSSCALLTAGNFTQLHAHSTYAYIGSMNTPARSTLFSDIDDIQHGNATRSGPVHRPYGNSCFITKLFKLKPTSRQSR